MAAPAERHAALALGHHSGHVGDLVRSASARAKVGTAERLGAVRDRALLTTVDASRRGREGRGQLHDVAAALPLGCPKVVLSTVAYSHLVPPERITPDLIMVLWAGGLYGLSSLCRSALAQAAGAVVGAALPPRSDRPLVGMTSLGKSCLAYMVALKPALEVRGYELAVFHTTGMGGRAFETLAAAGRFAAVMDFSLQELANRVGGSVVTAGRTG